MQQSVNYDYNRDILGYIDICQSIESNLVYFTWLFDLFEPLLIIIITLFLLPALIVIFIYITSSYIFIRKHWSKLKHALHQDIWQATYKSIAVFWETQGALWHGHEIRGLENIPDSGPALLIYYHAAMPIDFYYVHSKVVLYKNRRIKIVADNFLFKVPGLKSVLEAFEVMPGTQEGCISELNTGHVLAISPGGVREALFSDHSYEILWGSRVGFAKVATLARVPVIPMFTENCREALRTLPFFKSFFKSVYEKTRLPLVPIYGMFPVKMTTHIGKPIEFDENRTPEQLRDLTKQKLEELIIKNQRIPGSIFFALMERFKCFRRKRYHD